MKLWKCECKWHGEVRTLIICDLIEGFLLRFFFAIYNDKWTPGSWYGEYELRAQKYASLFALRKPWRSVELFNYKVEYRSQTFNEFQVKLNGNSQRLLACFTMRHNNKYGLSEHFFNQSFSSNWNQQEKEKKITFAIILVLLLPEFKSKIQARVVTKKTHSDRLGFLTIQPKKGDPLRIKHNVFIPQ